MKKLITRIHAFSIAAVLVPLLAVGGYSLLDADREDSARENRKLAQMPAFSLSALFSGQYTKDLETYYSDQFPGRDGLITANNALESLYAAFRFGDDVLILEGPGSDQGGPGQALPDPEPSSGADSSGAESSSASSLPSTSSSAASSESSSSFPDASAKDEDVSETSNRYVILAGTRAMELYDNNFTKIENYASIINRLKASLPADVKVYNLLAPTSVEFYAPSKYHSTRQKSQKEGIACAYEALQGVVGVDAYSAIAPHAKDEYLYFRTDHHWTARGAYYAYRAFAQTAGFVPAELSELQTGRLEGFVGSLNRYVKDGTLQNNPDYVEYFMPATTTEAYWYESASMEEGHSVNVINPNIEDASSKYLSFIGGDHPLTKITTDAPGGRSILVTKESYGNAMIPWLCNNYSTIYVVDPRSIKDMKLSDFVVQHEIQEVLCINYMFITGNEQFLDGLNRIIG